MLHIKWCSYTLAAGNDQELSWFNRTAETRHQHGLSISWIQTQQSHASHSRWNMAKMTRRKRLLIRKDRCISRTLPWFHLRDKDGFGDIGTIAVKITSETHVAAKAESPDASHCVHQKMSSDRKYDFCRDDNSHVMHTKWLWSHFVCIYNMPVYHMLFSTHLPCLFSMYYSRFMSKSFSI